MVDFTTYFKVVLIKTYASLVSILPKSIPDKTAGEKSDSLSPKSFFWTSKQSFAIHFFLASCNVCPMAHKDPITGNSFIQTIFTQISEPPLRDQVLL